MNDDFGTNVQITVADPGFPVGGVDPLGGGGVDLTQVLFAENVCKNEGIWSCMGGMHRAKPPPPPHPRSANESVLKRQNYVRIIARIIDDDL